jgi:membrane protease YdiL (CAAX protease family)
MHRRSFLRLEWGLATALAVLAFGVAVVRGLPLATPGTVEPLDALIGAACGALLWLAIPLLRLSARMRAFWDQVLVPFSRTLTTADIVVLALLSGVSEELFFRGVLLPETGLVASSVLFGLLHAANPVYFGWATLTGAGLGVLALATDSLAAPVTAHAVYNLGAFLVLRQWEPRTAAPDGPASGDAVAAPRLLH